MKVLKNVLLMLLIVAFIGLISCKKTINNNNVYNNNDDNNNDDPVNNTLPSVDYFFANPDVFICGNEIIIKWDVKNATGKVIIEMVKCSDKCLVKKWEFDKYEGELNIKPSECTVIIIFASNANGQVIKELTLSCTNNPDPNKYPPIANFNFDINKFLVSFYDDSKRGSCDIVNWIWNFGDGSQSNEQNPKHEYASSGSYVVTLKVIDCNNLFDQVSKTIQINKDDPEDPIPPSIIDFFVTPKKIHDPQQCTLHWKVKGATAYTITSSDGYVYYCGVNHDNLKTHMITKEVWFTLIAKNKYGESMATCVVAWKN